MNDSHTDGNEVAGLLAEFAAAEITTTVRRCQHCHDEHAVGSHRAYRGAGIVLRCPGCGAVAVRVATVGDELVVEWSGTYRAARVAEESV
jgi:Zn finger protein HypA/HybF involved in hydrogenase expression